ncbi:BglG family transcription antiterminator [Clostridium sp. OS1-26]|uniref:BglG family transcription antiterminator n=1 Tax=Clostridium sp. OS1-26 TaxID=3070681 RepID=UPI0027DF945C|nr:BglG family transcription antiterminator [Clostridium sp. OS1-26]WML34191.1 BglG family transcription antiterminator [Clostridium sp. OS1-26]
MELNKNCIEILQYLRKKDDFVRIQELAEIYKLTDRAIRYKIDKIEQFMIKNGFKYLDKQHIKGIRLISQPGLNEFLDSFIGEYTPYKYVYSKNERFEFIVMKMLQESKPVNLSYFQSKLCISKNTVLKEMDLIEKWLNERNLRLIRKPKVGILVDGNEVDKRKAIIELTSETISTEDIVNYINRRTAQSKINNLQFDTLFSDLDIDFIDSLIRNAEVELNKEFSDDAYGNLITHISIMIKRIELKKNIYIPEINLENLKVGIEYEVAKSITIKIEQHYNIKVPEEETNYITLHLLGAKVLKTGELYNVSEYEPDDLYNVSRAMTEEIEKIYNVSFGIQKDKIIEGLVLHLRPSIYRIKFKLKLINPLYDEIRLNYSELFSNTRLVARYLENYIGSKVDEHEISYIALHFGAALSNVKENEKRKVKIILVCGTGLGTAKMVSSQILDEFDVEIVDTVASRMVNHIKDKDFDFIISTVDIPDIDKDSYIKISPLMLKKDYEKLGKYLHIKYKKEENYDIEMQLVNRLIGIVEKYCDINDKQQLQYEFMYELKRNRKQFSEGKFTLMLNDLITFDVINLNSECRNWEEAIKAGMIPLIDKNYVNKCYEEAVINNLKELGPYMVVAPGIVLSHAKPENGVNKLSMSLMTIKYPVKFGSELNDPVKLVITLAARDNESHLKALNQLMELFMNSKDLNSILKATNKEQVIKIINKYSNK